MVEDDEAIRECLVDLLGEWYQVDGACNGLEALRLIESGREYQLMLLDIFMPIMDGPELLKRLALAGKLIPTLILTAGRMPANLGDEHPWLTKPFDLTVLEDAIKRCLGEKAQAPSL